MGSLFYISLFMFVLWGFDSYLKILKNISYEMLWYCSIGYLLTAISLLIKNRALFTAMFCTFILINGIWYLSFFNILLFNNYSIPMAEAIFDSKHSLEEYTITFYHLTFLPVLIFALFKMKKISPWGWLVAFFSLMTLALITYFFIYPKHNINCIKDDPTSTCLFFFPFFGQILEPLPQILRIIVAIDILAIFIFLPINLLLLLIFHKTNSSN